MNKQTNSQIQLDESTVVISVISLIDKLIRDSQFLDSNFTDLIQLYAKSQQTDQASKNSDILITKIHQKLSEFRQTISLEEQQKALHPIKIPKVSRLYVDGCFDLMHSGHYNALRQAKELCETLVCGVVSTEEISKRKGEPIMNLEERLILAESCKWVDEIYINAPYDPTIELLDKLNCSHVAHGDDILIKPDGEDCYGVFKKQNRFLEFKRTEGISTTDIVGRLLLMTKNQPSIEMKKIRKSSSEEGMLARDVKLSELGEEKNSGKIEQDLGEIKNQKIQLINTARRIQQFSQGNRAPTAKDVVVYLDGSFDILHIGHVKTLIQAKQLGTYLIVGIHDDETITKNKGNNYPICSLQERVLCVLALKYVDEVIIGAPWQVTENMIKQFNISYVVTGTILDVYSKASYITQEEQYVAPKKLGILKYIESKSDLTTEILIERIIKNRMKYLEIWKKKQKTQDEYYNTTQRSVQEI